MCFGLICVIEEDRTAIIMYKKRFWVVSGVLRVSQPMKQLVTTTTISLMDLWIWFYFCTRLRESLFLCNKQTTRVLGHMEFSFLCSA